MARRKTSKAVGPPVAEAPDTVPSTDAPEPPAVTVPPEIADRSEGEARELTTKAMHAVRRMVAEVEEPPATKAKRRRKKVDPHAAELVKTDGEIAAARARHRHIKAEIARLDAVAMGPHTAEEEALIRAAEEIGKQIGRLTEHRVKVLSGLWEPPAPPAPVVPKAAPALQIIRLPDEVTAEMAPDFNVPVAELHKAVSLGVLLNIQADLVERLNKIFANYKEGIERAHHRLDQAIEAANKNVETLKALRDRVTELEARPVLKYVGTWNADTQFNPGEFCTDKGSLWHCNEPTRQRPGDGPAWRLAVKAGRDGRDAR
ncbi:MAG: hypothetical protein RLO51_16815 [Thalassobaculum sp.]|uniref:hypothetical protein n=1 Tax=Thalassobaculum sp. TaxID=2022740 RepID=UPI0032EDEA43